jgi:hypothetical protein
LACGFGVHIVANLSGRLAISDNSAKLKCELSPLEDRPTQLHPRERVDATSRWGSLVRFREHTDDQCQSTGRGLADERAALQYVGYLLAATRGPGNDEILFAREIVEDGLASNRASSRDLVVRGLLKAITGEQFTGDV